MGKFQSLERLIAITATATEHHNHILNERLFRQFDGYYFINGNVFFSLALVLPRSLPPTIFSILSVTI